MTTIDADAHVLETPDTWRYLRDDERGCTPMVVARASGAQDRGLEGQAIEEYWVIDGSIPAQGGQCRQRHHRRYARDARHPGPARPHGPARGRHPGALPDAVPQAGHHEGRRRARAEPELQSLARRHLAPGARPAALGDVAAAAGDGAARRGARLRAGERRRRHLPARPRMRPHAERPLFLPGLRGGRGAEPADLHPLGDQQPDHAPLLPRRFRVLQVQARHHRARSTPWSITRYPSASPACAGASSRCRASGCPM